MCERTTCLMSSGPSPSCSRRFGRWHASPSGPGDQGNRRLKSSDHRPQGFIASGWQPVSKRTRPLGPSIKWAEIGNVTISVAHGSSSARSAKKLRRAIRMRPRSRTKSLLRMIRPRWRDPLVGFSWGRGRRATRPPYASARVLHRYHAALARIPIPRNGCGGSGRGRDSARTSAIRLDSEPIACSASSRPEMVPRARPTPQ